MKLLKNIGTIVLAGTLAVGIAGCVKPEPMEKPKMSDYRDKCKRETILYGLEGINKTMFLDLNQDCMIDAEVIQGSALDAKYLKWIAPEFKDKLNFTGADVLKNFTAPYSDKVRNAATGVAMAVRAYEFQRDMAKYEAQNKK